MSKRFYYDEFTCDIFDEEIEDYPSNREICATLNYQVERIAELEEQLKNAISYCQSKIDNINNRYPEGAVISEWFSRECCIYEEMLKELQGE